MYITCGFKKPCYLTWIMSVVLVILGIFFGVMGYSLSWNQIDHWTVKVVIVIPEIECLL